MSRGDFTGGGANLVPGGGGVGNRRIGTRGTASPSLVPVTPLPPSSLSLSRFLKFVSTGCAARGFGLNGQLGPKLRLAAAAAAADLSVSLAGSETAEGAIGV